MNKQPGIQYRKNTDKRSKAKNGKPSRIAIVLVTLGVMIFSGLVLSCGKNTEQDTTKDQATSSESNAPGHPQRDLKKLVGRWLRPDGGYVIEIQDVRHNGGLDAGYFNPRPINVSQANASLKGDALEVFV
jgi:hypothetical protein